MVLLSHAAFALMLLVWAAAILRMLPDKFMWGDEFLSLLSASGRWGEMMQYLSSWPLVETQAQTLTACLSPVPGSKLSSFLADLSQNDIHPPAFFFLLRLMLTAGARSVMVLSLLPLSLSIVAVFFLYLTAGRLIERPYHLLVPGWWLTSIAAWGVGTEIRQYSLLFLCSCLLIYLAVAVRQKPEILSRRRRRWLWSVVTATGMLSQYMFIWLVLAVNLWLFFGTAVRERTVFWNWLKANMIGLLLFAPWLILGIPAQFQHQAARFTPDLGHLEVLRRLFEIAVHFVVSPKSIWAVSSLLVTGLVILGVTRHPPFAGFRSLVGWGIFCCFLLPGLLYQFNLLRIWQLFQVKYFLPAAPFILLSLAQGVAALPRAWLRLLVIIVLTSLIGLNFQSFREWDLKKKTGDTPTAVSLHPVLVRYLKKQAPAPYLFILNTHDPAWLFEIVSQCDPLQPILIGDCESLPSRLSEYLRSKNYASLLLFQPKLPDLDPNSLDCNRQIIKTLEPDYTLFHPPAEVLRWKILWMVRNSFPPR